jgi:uncharacterized protein (DUF433 family)
MNETASVELPLGPAQLPLRVDQGGVVRIGSSRISLDTIVQQYEGGKAAEDIVRAYDTLALADVHTAIGYYLSHRQEVRQYLDRREKQAQELRKRIESQRPGITRQELVERMDLLENDHAAPRQ